jgi:hypothetical protein
VDIAHRIAVALVLLSGCGPGAQAFEPTPPPPVQESPAQTARTSSGQGGPTGQDAPEISRSEGEAGGVVVFWPRVIPRSSDAETKDLASRLQQKAAALVKQALPDAAVDVRPEPERVCPQNGCKAITVGILLTRSKDACAAFALVSGSGTSPARIVTWAGDAKIGQDTVKFREPPENQVKITDFVRCSSLLDSLGQREGDVVKAIKAAAGK